MNIVITDEHGDLLYGHQLVSRIIQTGRSNEVQLTEWVPIDVYIAYLSVRFPDNHDVQALLAATDSGEGSSDLLSAVSNSVELTPHDAEMLLKGDSRG